MQLIPAPTGFPTPPLAFWTPQGYEWLIILALALLFFGKRLPSAARGIGHGILEFKRGMKGAGPDGNTDVLNK